MLNTLSDFWGLPAALFLSITEKGECRAERRWGSLSRKILFCLYIVNVCRQEQTDGSKARFLCALQPLTENRTPRAGREDKLCCAENYTIIRLRLGVESQNLN